MANSTRLFIGWPEDAQEFTFHNANEWEAVRSQIENAWTTGRGTITVTRPDRNQNVYVYSPSMKIMWTNFVA